MVYYCTARPLGFYIHSYADIGVSLIAQLVKNLPAIQLVKNLPAILETPVRFLVREDTLERG